MNPSEDDPYNAAVVLIDFLQTLITPLINESVLEDIISQYEMFGDQDDMVL